ncbi:hypothetical protein QJS04_geneDACA004963 [Acorus gramineus]|uniref:Uncharacterized protein n=1 Tax=Acorus gramineus TaxID=55184 RepID=A0AAV9BWM8_ACOGR|nr:hypothetical protein QJS04_geneDACA004963 [Acorus gramineus]
MGKLSNVHVFLLVLLVISSAEMVRVADGARCQKVLSSGNCNLSSCRQQCLQQLNGNGVCVADAQFNYSCSCVYNC